MRLAPGFALAAAAVVLRVLVPSKEAISGTEVRVLDWDLWDSSARLETPIVVRGAPIGSWECSRWNETYLAAKLGAIEAKRGNSRVFRYYLFDKPFRDLEGVTQEPEWEHVEMNAKDFLEAAKAEFLYLAMQLKSFPELAKQVPLFPNFMKGNLRETPVVNLWIGHGVIADTHYDTSDNFYVQLQGRKTFVVLPPSAESSLGLYPFLHPEYRRARNPIRDSESLNLKLDLLASLGAEFVTLEPGDILFIPAYFFHNVEAVGDGNLSISVNFWSNSETYQISEEIFKLPVPFEEHWEGELLQKALKTYLEMIADMFGSGFRRDLLSHMRRRFNGLKGIEADPSFSSCGLFESKLASEMQRGINSIQPLFQQLSPPIRLIYLVNYIEVLVHFVHGTENVHSFVKSCLENL